MILFQIWSKRGLETVFEEDIPVDKAPERALELLKSAENYATVKVFEFKGAQERVQQTNWSPA